MSDAAPDLLSELERKTQEHLVNTLWALEQGAIGRDEARGAVKALWGMTAGLVSRDLMNLIADTANSLENA